ncbi:MAG TPA: APC family permease [Thermoanaerobaculia bacterium]|nr:APC family permease [Thermoanaerobaculia bacterium]
MSDPVQAGRRKLLTVLGVTFGIAVTVGNSIGAGILRVPGTIAGYLPEFWPYMAIWVVGALYALLGTNALAELGTMVPRSGGQYVFVRHALGDYAGFVVGWSDWLSTCGTSAAVAILVGEYAVGLIPELRTPVVVALVVVATLTIIQWMGVRWGGGAQTLTSIMKAIALLVLVAACFILGSHNPTASTMQVEREMPFMVALLLSLQGVIYTYDGWSAPIYFTEEMRDYGRSVPRSMFAGLATVTAVYLLINIGFAAVVPLPTLAGKNFAAATVAEHLFGMNGDTVLRVIMVVSLISAVNSSILMAPRVLFAMSQDGLFWRAATEVNRGGTPDVALLINSVIAAGFIVTGTFDTVIAKLAFFFVANYALSFLSLFVLRRREPDAARPYRAWGHPIATGIALVASVSFLIGAVVLDPKNSLYTLALLAVSIPAFAAIRAAGRARPVAGE